MESLPTPHNNFFHVALSHLPNARSLIQTQPDAKAAQELKPDTLRLETGSFIDPDLRERFSDLLFSVDLANPPIAGLGSIPAADGLTTQYLYDDNLADGIGLDSSTGLAYTKMATGSGTANVSLATALAKLADTQANGGAGVSFASTSAGTARVTINPQDEVSFSISDAAGRSVMSGQLDNYVGTANSLLTWSTQQHDTTSNVSGYGDCLEARSIDALGKLTRSLSDAAGRTIQSIDQLSKITSFTYDAAGNRLSVRDPNNVGQDCIYDIRGRDTQCTDTAGAVAKKDYDKTGNVIKQTDAKNKFTYITFDARGREKTSTDRINGVTTRTYLATGQLDTLNDAQNQTTTYTYDDAGVKLTEQYPDHTGGTPGQIAYGVITFTLDPASRVVVKRDQKGDTCKYIYDLAGRMTARQYRTLANSPSGVPSGTIADTDSFTVDKASRMLTAITGRYANTVTYTYDTAGRKKTEGLTIGGITYTTSMGYNSRNELTQYTYPDGTLVGRSYTNRGELYQLIHAGTTIDTRAYDNGGRITSNTYNNGVVDTRVYNNDNTLASISYSGASVGNLNYSWDANKNKTAEAISGTMSNYGFTIPTSGYDNEARLTSYTRTTGLTQSWNLSTVGDWNSVITNGTAQNRTYGPTHELLTATGQNVTTDVIGNITLIPAALRANGQALASTWDFDNRMVTADAGNNGSIEARYEYDAVGRRISTFGSNGYVYHIQIGQQTIADYAEGDPASDTQSRYVYASYIDEPVLRYRPSGSESTYYHQNQQYSVIALTNGAGSIVERYAYTAYGLPTIANASGTVLTTSAINNRYMYTGREWDNAIAKYHYRARMYDANLGRFCSRDPIGYQGRSLSLYQYVQGHVVTFVDPFGFRPSWPPPVPPSMPFWNPYPGFNPPAPTSDAYFQDELFEHYMTGDGEDFYLNNLFDNWQNDSGTQEKIDEIKHLLSPPCGTSNVTGSYRRLVDYTHGRIRNAPYFGTSSDSTSLWQLGNAWIKIRFSCDCETDCKIKHGYTVCRTGIKQKTLTYACFHCDCEMIVELGPERFKDAKDTFNVISGDDWEFDGGIPFDINAGFFADRSVDECVWR